MRLSPSTAELMSRKLLIILVVVVLAVALPILRNVIGGGNVQAVETEKLARRSIQASVLASGQLAHEEEVNLMSEEIGRVTQLLVEEGDRVKAGELLLQIDDEAHRAAVEQNQAQVRLQEIAIERQRLRLENLRARWERQQALFAGGLMDGDGFGLLTNGPDAAGGERPAKLRQLAQ